MNDHARASVVLNIIIEPVRCPYEALDDFAGGICHLNELTIARHHCRSVLELHEFFLPAIDHVHDGFQCANHTSAFPAMCIKCSRRLYSIMVESNTTAHFLICS